MSDIVYIILWVLLIIIIYIIIEFNVLIKLLNKVKKETSNIEVYLNQRFDLIPNLVSTVKGYMKHESKVLTEVTELRSGKLDVSKANKLNKDINKILAIAEDYPDLKANTEFLKLQDTLNEIEDKLSYSRKYYNHAVTKYNTKLQVFPTNIISSIFAFKKMELFKIEDYKKENIKVEL